MYEKVFVATLWALLKDERKVKVIFVIFLDVIKPQELNFQDIKQGMSSRKSIRHHIRFALLMFDHIGKLLNKLYPFGMSLVKFALDFQTF